MTANELADELENTYPFVGVMEVAAIMLRQQQAEIEELKTKMSLNSYDDAKNVANQLLQSDNEPVAWIINGRLSDEFYTTSELDKIIPLYTHPADESFDRTASHMAGEYVSYPAKTLTDEEILQEAWYILATKWQRKAQEK